MNRSEHAGLCRIGLIVCLFFKKMLINDPTFLAQCHLIKHYNHIFPYFNLNFFMNVWKNMGPWNIMCHFRILYYYNILYVDEHILSLECSKLPEEVPDLSPEGLGALTCTLQDNQIISDNDDSVSTESLKFTTHSF